MCFDAAFNHTVLHTKLPTNVSDSQGKVWSKPKFVLERRVQRHSINTSSVFQLTV